MEGGSMLTWPPEVLAFLKAHRIDVAQYEAQFVGRPVDGNPDESRGRTAVPRRYFRLNPLTGVTLDTVERELQTAYPEHDWEKQPLQEVDRTWCHVQPFYSIPGHLSIAALPAFQRGDLHAMDVGSAIAVQALSIEPDDHVLDLCCAPGNKMALIASLLQSTAASSLGCRRPGVGTVTGVDIAKHRLHTTKSAVLSRLKCLNRCRLFLADGTTFREPPVQLPVTYLQRLGASSSATLEVESQPFESAIKPFYVPRLLVKGGAVPSLLYDKVLVDAECTHDGSMTHVLKQIVQAVQTDSARQKRDWHTFLNASLHRAHDRPLLQLALLENGFRMLRPGGQLVYSTCSLTREQNEEVIYAFLRQHEAEAMLMDLPDRAALPISSFRPESADKESVVDEDNLMKTVLDKTVRLGGYHAGLQEEQHWLSGLFIALLGRIEYQ